MRCDYLNKNNDDMTDEELDGFIDTIVKAVRNGDNVPHIMSQQRFSEMEAAYRILLRMAKGNGWGRVSYVLNEPYKSMGSISVEAKSISLPSDIFLALCELSRNIDIYALSTGNIKLDLTFNGLASPIV